MLIFRAIIVSALFTIFAVIGAVISGLYDTTVTWASDPWVVGITVFVCGSVLGIIKPVLISGFF